MTQHTHSMLEKVARAIEPHFSAADKAYGKHFDAARAAVQALMEPDEGLIRVMRARAVFSDCTTDRGARDIWSSISAAMLRPLVEGDGE